MAREQDEKKAATKKRDCKKSGCSQRQPCGDRDRKDSETLNRTLIEGF